MERLKSNANGKRSTKYPPLQFPLFNHRRISGAEEQTATLADGLIN
jgi:hypothetical protein